MFVTERLDYFSAVALLGVSLIVAIIRVASLRVEASRVLVAAPITAWLITHCLYLSFFRFDYGQAPRCRFPAASWPRQGIVLAVWL